LMNQYTKRANDRFWETEILIYNTLYNYINR
jgi:hypothetical protein